MLMKSDGTSVPDFESNTVEIDFGNAGDTASRRDTWRRSRRALVNHKKSVCGCDLLYTDCVCACVFLGLSV